MAEVYEVVAPSGAPVAVSPSRVSRTIEIADETGHVVDEINSRDVLFHKGVFRSYSDDVTQSAPKNDPSR